MGIRIPALFDIPKPNFVPHDNHAKDEAVSVEHATPNIFAEFL